MYILIYEQSHELHLVNVSVRHMGVYRCVANNNIKPPAEHLAELRVFHAPRTRVVQNSVGQAQNRRFSAKLECIVQGMVVIKLLIHEFSL